MATQQQTNKQTKVNSLSSRFLPVEENGVQLFVLDSKVSRPNRQLELLVVDVGDDGQVLHVPLLTTDHFLQNLNQRIDTCIVQYCTGISQ